LLASEPQNTKKQMTRLLTPGLKFFAEQIDPLYPPTGLYPTMSTYQFGLDLEGGPKRNELYVVCKNGTIQSVYEPGRPIGWELIEEGDEFWYRVTQMNHPRKRCAVRYHSRVEDPPAGRGSIGSVVQIYRRVDDPPQEAEVTEQKDEGDEVTSQLKSIATIDPLLAHCAVLLGDPDQTAALAKFAEGKMSYAEMRGLCG
jgi:hypothetical protein